MRMCAHVPLFHSAHNWVRWSTHVPVMADLPDLATVPVLANVQDNSLLLQCEQGLLSKCS